ncbi:MAG: hypothetical protein ABJA71_13415, partial [Ginsengibacter sp.]
PIKILASKSSNGTLTLSDHGHSQASRGDSVTWQIGNKSGVASITSVQKKPFSPEIFSTPPRRQGSNWRGVISSTTPSYTNYEYSIFWLANDGTGPYEYDPKISVNPRIYLFKKKLILFSLALFALLSLVFLRRNRK